MAIKLNKIQIIDSLLKSKSMSNILLDSLPNGYKPLLDACENDLTEIAIKLAKGGANLNIEDEKYLNWTPLMYAISNLNEQLVFYFIENGSNVNHLDNEMNTPLHVATETENEFIVKKLLNAGAKKNVTNNENMSPLDIARSNEDDTMVTLLK